MTVRALKNRPFSLPFWKLLVLLSVAAAVTTTTTRSNNVATGFSFHPPFKSTKVSKISFQKKSFSRTLSPASVVLVRRLEPLSSILDDLNNNNNKSSKEESGGGGCDNGSVDFTNFNPFSYTASSSKSTTASSRLEYTTRINLRKTRMQELTSTLLDHLGNAMETQQVLEDYRDFLLEPLEDSQAVLVRQTTTSY
jgi:hypothetical protein